MGFFGFGKNKTEIKQDLPSDGGGGVGVEQKPEKTAEEKTAEELVHDARVAELASKARERESNPEVLAMINCLELAGIEIPEDTKLVPKNGFAKELNPFPSGRDPISDREGYAVQQFNWDIRNETNLRKQDYTSRDGEIGPVNQLQVDSITQREEIDKDLEIVEKRINVFGVDDAVEKVTSVGQLRYIGSFSVNFKTGQIKKIDKVGKYQ